VARIAGLAARFARLRHTANGDKRIAFILPIPTARLHKSATLSVSMRRRR